MVPWTAKMMGHDGQLPPSNLLASQARLRHDSVEQVATAGTQGQLGVRTKAVKGKLAMRAKAAATSSQVGQAVEGLNCIACTCTGHALAPQEATRMNPNILMGDWASGPCHCSATQQCSREAQAGTPSVTGGTRDPNLRQIHGRVPKKKSSKRMCRPTMHFTLPCDQ